MALIAVTKERRAGETRVAAVPETVKKLIAAGFTVTVETGAGAAASYPDADYAACIEGGRRSWIGIWAEECRTGWAPNLPPLCPNGISGPRFQGICLDLVQGIPCTAMHSIGTYLRPSCDLRSICMEESPRDASGQ